MTGMGSRVGNKRARSCKNVSTGWTRGKGFMVFRLFRGCADRVMMARLRERERVRMCVRVCTSRQTF